MNRVYDIKPIPTTFNGVTYKSRLEARWGVFFDWLDIEAFYEYEGYQLPSGWYLPDFYIPSMNRIFEVKPTDLTEQEYKLCEELASSGGFDVGLLTGDMKYRDMDNNEGFSTVYDEPYYFCVCPHCGKVGFEYDGRGARVCGNKCLPGSDKSYSSDSPILIAAFEYASHYQFKVGKK